jgi:uncharacterized protein (DUF2147 family)
LARAALALCLCVFTSSAQAAASPAGLWWTKGREAVVAIGACGQALCGRLVGLPRQSWEPEPTDVHGRSQCGLAIIHGERPDAEGGWRGWISDPRTGASYRARLSIDSAGDLHVRGFLFVPLLGRSQIWTRFHGRVDATCQVSGG